MLRLPVLRVVIINHDINYNLHEWNPTTRERRRARIARAESQVPSGILVRYHDTCMNDNVNVAQGVPSFAYDQLNCPDCERELFKWWWKNPGQQ